MGHAASSSFLTCTQTRIYIHTHTTVFTSIALRSWPLSPFSSLICHLPPLSCFFSMCTPALRTSRVAHFSDAALLTLRRTEASLFCLLLCLWYPLFLLIFSKLRFFFCIVFALILGVLTSFACFCHRVCLYSYIDSYLLYIPCRVFPPKAKKNVAMNRLFGKSNTAPKPTLGDASNRISGRSDVVDARVAKIDAELVKLKEQIQRSRGMAQNRYKQRAVQLLQQKRMYQSQQDMMMQQQFNVDQLQFTTETVKDTQVQVDAMKQAKKEISKNMQKLNIDKVDQLQDDLADLYMDTQEIQEIMGRGYDVPEDIDEDEMLGELDALDFDMEKDNDADYLSDALAMPGAKMPELPGGKADAGHQQESNNTADPYSLEAQLGL